VSAVPLLLVLASPDLHARQHTERVTEDRDDTNRQAPGSGTPVRPCIYMTV